MSFQIIIDALTKIVTDIVTFIPNLVNGLIILIIGYLIAYGLRWIIRLVLRRFDPLVERSGVTAVLRRFGMHASLSTLVAQIFFVLLLLSFLITATRLMGLEAVARLLEELLTYLPRAIAALIIFLLGGLAAEFVGNLISTLGDASGLANAPRAGQLVRLLIGLFSLILALGQLGVDTSLLVTAVTIAIGAIGLAVGLGLGLGSRRTVEQILAGYYVRQRFPIGTALTVGEVSGTVSAISSVNTTIAAADAAVVLPHTVLLEGARTSNPEPIT